MTEINLKNIISNIDNSREPAPKLQGLGYGIVEPIEGADKPSLFALALGSPDHKQRYCDLIDQYEEGLADLATSIDRQGQLQNCRVRHASKNKYTLTFGARRCLAVLYLHAKHGKAAVVTTTVSKADSKAAVIESAAENIHLPPSFIDQARLFKRLRDEGMVVKEIARVCPMGKATEQNIRHRLRLLELPLDIQLKVHHGKLSQDNALKLLKNHVKGEGIPHKTPVTDGKGEEGKPQQPMQDEGETQVGGVRKQSSEKENVPAGKDADLRAILQGFVTSLNTFDLAHFSPAENQTEMLQLVNNAQRLLSAVKRSVSKAKLTIVG